MPRTITDEEYTSLRSGKQIADFIEPIYNSPQFGEEARALIKKAYPNIAIEGYDLKRELKGEIEKVRSEHQESERKRDEAREANKYKQLRDRTQKEYKFTDEAMEKLEKLMLDKNIGDYEAAATYMASKEPKTSDPTHGGRSGSGHYWQHDKEKDFAEISKDPEKWGFNQLVEAAERDAARARNREF